MRIHNNLLKGLEPPFLIAPLFYALYKSGIGYEEGMKQIMVRRRGNLTTCLSSIRTYDLNSALAWLEANKTNSRIEWLNWLQKTFKEGRND